MIYYKKKTYLLSYLYTVCLCNRLISPSREEVESLRYEVTVALNESVLVELDVL